MPTVKENLIAARKVIEKPDNWTQEQFAGDINGKPADPRTPDAVCFCSLGALLKVGAGISDLTAWELRKAMNGRIDKFNDTHTHSEVLAAFDRAIASCE